MGKDIDPRTGRSTEETSRRESDHEERMRKSDRDAKDTQRDLNSRVQRKNSRWS